MDKGFHFFDLACWFANSFPNKIITIANPLSTKEFLENNDYSDAVINMKFKNKKSLGQNFLVDKNILKKIADIGKISENDKVIEVGPGNGNLTEYLIKKKPYLFFTK